ncbi:hypothetical protein [Sulfurimonas sp. CVO]|uniref:hypothetical protein n=1 Tax=Sulfurimonas sp. CVO TaxID=2283483 RepID=UPI00135C59C1|nr:hypothetical protein [Sulfurimonas sp. CVO]
MENNIPIGKPSNMDVPIQSTTNEMDLIIFAIYIGFSIFLLTLTWWIDFRKNKTKEQTSNIEKIKTQNFIEASFTNVKFYKVFIVTQIFFLIVLFIFDISNENWDLIFSYSSYSGFKINSTLFDGYRSTSIIGDYLTIATFLIPIFLSKSLDWILRDNK